MHSLKFGRLPGARTPRCLIVELPRAVAEWDEHGVVVLPRFVSSQDLGAAQRELPLMFPTLEEFHDNVDDARNARYRGDEFAGITDFPFDSVEWSLLAVHPRLVDLAQSLLGTDDVRLYAAEAWAKFTGAADYDQEHHRDYLNHTILVPSDDRPFHQVEMFLYLSDVSDDLGPTHFASKQRTRDLAVIPNWHARADRPELYEAEVSGAGPAGTVVAYSINTTHRGTAMTAPRGARYTIHVNYRAATSEWAHRHAWASRSHHRAWYRFVERASVRQLLLFGFPPPGHAFWTDATLAAMALRYPNLDLSQWRP